MNRIIASFLSDVRGATSIEYGMIALLISIAMLAAMTSISGSMADIYGVIPGAP